MNSGTFGSDSRYDQTGARREPNRLNFAFERRGDRPQTRPVKLLPNGSREAVFIRQSGGDENANTPRK